MQVAVAGMKDICYGKAIVLRPQGYLFQYRTECGTRNCAVHDIVIG